MKILRTQRRRSGTPEAKILDGRRRKEKLTLKRAPIMNTKKQAVIIYGTKDEEKIDRVKKEGTGFSVARREGKNTRVLM